MSTSTIGIVAGNYTAQVWEVVAAVKEAIIPLRTTAINGREVSALASLEIDLSCCHNIFDADNIFAGRIIRFHFNDGKDSRTLYCFFDCHCDYKDILDGEKLIFSLGAWGNAEQIIKSILNQPFFLAQRRFFMANDFGETWEQL